MHRTRSSLVLGAALFIYHYFLTFSEEVKYVWRRKISAVSVLFLVNRYVVFINRLVRLVQVVSWEDYTEAPADYVSWSSFFFPLISRFTL